MPGRHFLFVPGPTNVPDRVLRAMHRAQEDHRSSAFPAFSRSLFPALKKVFRTVLGQPFIFAATGSAMWEACLVNALSPGDRVLAVRNGQFSHLFIDCALRLGMQVDVIDLEWGEPADADRIGGALAADTAHEIRAVLVVHNETATGVTSDLGAVRRAMDRTAHPALLCVDGVSSIGSLDFRFDEWQVDFAIAGSQKGFMMPAGVGLLCASQKALALGDQARCPRAFFDLRDQIKHNADGYFPYTPPLAHLFGLREALDMLFEEGLENVTARHHRLGEGVRRAITAWGLALCARDRKSYSGTVSAVVVPDGADARRVIDIAFRRYNLSLGAGLGRLSGKVFRIGHVGDLNELMLLGALAGVEMALKDAEIPVALGSGVAAAQGWWRESADPRVA
ncbi:MAG TPA: aminotransferase class V-fold PLP-dependent enzyme [Gemmatimonadaceae bacterium]|nr:aminotransferase class V-fold PLP-dependent enzyme [Gemmatimonadaceae bacterium]